MSNNTVDTVPASIDATVKSLQDLAHRLRHERFTVLGEIAVNMHMTVLPISEHTDLLQRAQRTKTDIAAEVKQEVDRQVEKLNSELKHRVEMEQLKNLAELQILKAKVAMMETAPPVIDPSSASVAAL